LTAVHIANVFAHELLADKEEIQPKIDEAYLNGIGLSERLPIWRDAILGGQTENPERSEKITQPVQVHASSQVSTRPRANLEATPPVAIPSPSKNPGRSRLVVAVVLAAALTVLGLALALSR
jgi:hypothetical protein